MELSLKYNIPDFVDIYAPHYPSVETLKYYAETATKPVILTEYCHSLGQSLEEHKELWELIEANKNLAGGNVWE
jgi:beta-galactosidase